MCVRGVCACFSLRSGRRRSARAANAKFKINNYHRNGRRRDPTVIPVGRRAHGVLQKRFFLSLFFFFFSYFAFPSRVITPSTTPPPHDHRRVCVSCASTVVVVIVRTAFRPFAAVSPTSAPWDADVVTTATAAATATAAPSSSSSVLSPPPGSAVDRRSSMPRRRVSIVSRAHRTDTAHAACLSDTS